MKLKDIAIKNILRRKIKSLFLITGLVVGVSTVVAIISFVKSMTIDINHKMEKFGANIIIMPKTENLTLTYGDFSLGGVSYQVKKIKEDELAKIKKIKNAGNLAAVGPMLLDAVSVNKQLVLLAGVDFNKLRILKPWWKVDGKYPEFKQVVAGSQAARVLNIKKGDTLFIRKHKLKVSAILEPTGSQDDKIIFANLKAAQKILNREGEITMAEVAALCNACPIDELVTQIREVLPESRVMAIQQVVKSRMQSLGQFKKFSYLVSGIVLFVGTLVVFITMMGSVNERRKEIGIFRALGFRKTHVMTIILYEAFIISLIAGVIGYFTGFGASKMIINNFTDTKTAVVSFNGELAGAAVLLALLIGLLATIYPARVAAKLDPNDAIRTL